MSIIPNPWAALRQFTAARIALGRTGVSQPVAAHLAFQLAHARARDAVHHELETGKLAAGLAAAGLDSLVLHSAAADRHTYLQRPDLGRLLDAASRLAMPAAVSTCDLAIVIADGLSALAIEQNALPFLQVLMARLAPEQWTYDPVALVRQGRVAIGDEIGELFGAKAVLVLIGERPGLSSPDSMGLYLTWAPRRGLSDAARNCISNVRAAGLSYEDAACKLHYLLSESRRRQISGVALKDETQQGQGGDKLPEPRFLL